MDQQIGQALQGFQKVPGALEAKVKEVTIFLKRTGVPPQNNEEEEAQSTVLLVLEKDLSGYQIRVLETIEF